MELSIIIPVCNVEQYIGPCLESIYRQGLRDNVFEVIVVNDGSTDNSMEVVKGIMSLHHNIHILNQDNAGPSVSRNVGMERAMGEYVLFVDSDDVLMDNGLSFLLSKAIGSSVDMVVADYMRLKDDEIISHYDSQFTDSQIIDKTGFDYYVENYDPSVGSFIWRILYKRAFLNENHIRLFPGVYYEDIPFLQECFLKARRVIGVHLLYYIYRIRQRSCTYSFSMKNAMDYNTAIANSWRLTNIPNLPENVRRQQKKNIYLLFNYAMDCIIGVFGDSSDRKKIIDDLRKKVPDLSFSGGVNPMAASVLFNAMPYAYVQWRLFNTKVTNWFQARFLTKTSKVINCKY
jgi:glycosyltransferase involved in cell wall biosynthesis